MPQLARLADQNDAEFFALVAPADRQAMERVLREIVKQRDLKIIPID